MQLQELVKDMYYKGNPDNCEITAVTYDSRKVKAGTLFVAIAGFKMDGHDYIYQAIENGAAAILSNGRSPNIKTVPIIQVKNPRIALSQISAQFYGNPSKSMNVIGVTGTNGKTSITHILYHILQFAGYTCGSMGTLGFRTPTGMMNTGFTTPESVEVHQMLQTLKIAGVDNVVMEISSHALDLYRVKDVDVDIAIFSNLTPEHLDFHGDMENYFKSKLKLFTELNSTKTAVINIDDPYAERICVTTPARVITYGMNQRADIRPLETKFSINGLDAKLAFGESELMIHSNLLGEYNLSNLMSAFAVSLAMGLPPHNIERAISSLPPIPGRLEQITCNCPGKVFIDYAHTPDAYEKLFFTLTKLKSKKDKIITIFGCGGDRDVGKRSKMAEISEAYSIFSYITLDNPRTESPDQIIADIIQGFSTSNYEIINDRKTSLETALNNMDDDSILLVLGKGRENYQQIGMEKFHYSDVKIIEEFQYAG
jgi:UDP-N-acetylmuramoyl-L-alanyl-D-glutamate--2,6-diaminopimelate ligase